MKFTGLLLLGALLVGCQDSPASTDVEKVMESGTYQASEGLVLTDNCNFELTSQDISANSFTIIASDRALIVDNEVTLDRANDALHGVTMGELQAVEDVFCAFAIQDTYTGTVMGHNKFRLIDTIDFIGTGDECYTLSIPCRTSFSMTLEKVSSKVDQNAE